MISVILPTYNESGNIRKLIELMFEEVPAPLEVVVVDDDSPDRTWEVAKKMKSVYPSIKVLRRVGKKGLTSALRDGIKIAEGNTIVWMDADLSIPPSKIPELLEKIIEGYDMVIGSRYVAGGGTVILEKEDDSLVLAILSFVLNLVIQKILDPSVHDYTSGFVAVRKAVLDQVRLKGDHGEYFISLTYKAIKNGFRVTEVPYILGSRSYGVSKTGTRWWHYFLKGFNYLIVAFSMLFYRGTEKRK
ncbi:MAG: polyprenol monophosphomannose synthase [Acidiferrobacteraceae bacterium]|nr:polyprenol monophosphomannose synthase [Acidiferrobacteraceae bacterium]